MQDEVIYVPIIINAVDPQLDIGNMYVVDSAAFVQLGWNNTFSLVFLL